ncbi:RluA family pseudouridine synthase [Anaeromyxobacter oryzae]|uniref:Pseudouridine synthase n=1 Tax=Anaeromyxobacter oryzae TaxID=2918170 RepID=A0ABM7WZF9_9BACT|nr:RluA family pseudouridine synthase [Anaeromyxobacter oryzae]BDG04875.1 pseudouridine synthase [Anaeromyxobacter oryzae]
MPRSDAGERLDRFLSRALALPVERIRSLVAAGSVRIRGKTCSPHRKLFGGEAIDVARPAPVAAAASGPELVVLHDDADCLVVAKPAGLAVEPSRIGGPSVVTAASRLGAFDVDGRAVPGLPHRLDRDTTGALLLARSDRALAALRAAFEAGRVEKDYLALVAGAPPDRGRLDTPYARSPADPRRFTTRVPSARRARLSFEVAARLEGAALLRVALETGRTHQIRVQLAEAGWPVLGDPVYGVPSPVIARQALHAERLAFPRPADGARVEVRAPVPDDLARALEALGGGPR